MEHIPIVEYSDNEKSFQDVIREFRKEYEFFRELFEIWFDFFLRINGAF